MVLRELDEDSIISYDSSLSSFSLALIDSLIFASRLFDSDDYNILYGKHSFGINTLGFDFDASKANSS